jgi:hypothetical protein
MGFGEKRFSTNRTQRDWEDEMIDRNEMTGLFARTTRSVYNRVGRSRAIYTVFVTKRLIPLVTS